MTDLVAQLLDRAQVAAQLAGDLLMNRPETIAVDSKSTVTDIVTEMDRRSERLIVDQLLYGRPDDGVLGEEGSDRPGTSGVRWVIDPIDGTVNYLYRLPEWSVCIGAEIDGEPVVGVVFMPVLGEMYFARKGGGAWCRTAAGVHQLRVGQETELSMSLIGTGFGYLVDRRRTQAEIVAAVLPQVRDIRRAGAASVDLCGVAAGRLDGYYERGLNPWDHVAASVVAREAGAIVAGLNGAPPTAALTIAANPVLFGKLHDMLEPLRPDRD